MYLLLITTGFECKETFSTFFANIIWYLQPETLLIFTLAIVYCLKHLKALYIL